MENEFSYDKSVPLNAVEEVSEVTEGGIKVSVITYDAYDQTINTSGKISAYLVMPSGEGPFPCVLFFHWLGNANSNKDEFLEEAKVLATQGIAGFLIDGYFPWKENPTELKKDKELVGYQVIEARRALDYIETIPNIDTTRLGYVGHDYGAMFGSVMAGVDKRISCYVLMAAMGNFTDWFIQYWSHVDDAGNKLTEEAIEDYRTRMSELDPVNFISDATPAKLFFQFAEDDRYISKEIADEFYQAASEPKEEKTYDAQHEMKSEEAELDRRNWLVENLIP